MTWTDQLFLVFRHRRVHIIRPSQNAANQILYLAITSLFHKVDNLAAADPASAMDHNLIVCGQLVKPLGDGSFRDQPRVGYSADRILLGFPHVYKHEV